MTPGWFCDREGDVLTLNMHTYRVLILTALAAGVFLGLVVSIITWAVLDA